MAGSASSTTFMERDKDASRWKFKPDILQEVAKVGYVNAAMLDGPFGNKLTVEDLAALEKELKKNPQMQRGLGVLAEQTAQKSQETLAQTKDHGALPLPCDFRRLRQ